MILHFNPVKKYLIKKTKDMELLAGAAAISIVDQLFIKAARIRTIQQTVNKKLMKYNRRNSKRSSLWHHWT